MMREPTEPQASIKANGVGIPRLQAWEEVNIAEHYDTIIAMIPFEIINNIAYIHWIENNDFNAIRLFNRMLSMISCNHIILNADRMNDYHDYESYGFVSSSMSSPVLIDFTGNIDNKYNDIVSKYSYYNSGMNEFMMTL